MSKGKNLLIKLGDRPYGPSVFPPRPYGGKT